jgi:hypothetical protein
MACGARFDFDVPASERTPSVGGSMAGGGATGDGTGGACSSDQACGFALLHCDVRRGACVECVVDAHCAETGFARCDAATQRCVECGLDADCTSDEGCEPFSRRCVQRCNEDAECGDPTLACDSERGLCFECEEDDECERSPRGPRCLRGGSSCAECLEDDDWQSGRCDALRGVCVQCLDAFDCDADDLCDPESHRCAER